VRHWAGSRVSRKQIDISVSLSTKRTQVLRRSVSEETLQIEKRELRGKAAPNTESDGTDTMAISIGFCSIIIPALNLDIQKQLTEFTSSTSCSLLSL
jgi:hypothetical protein